MADRTRILLPRSDIPGRVPTPNEIDFGEIAVNTHDGKAFIKRKENGEVTIETIGSEQVDNVYYVSKSGDYGNDGRSLMNSFKTLDSAVATVLTKQGFKFNKDICERDLQLIMDAIRYDMILETNFNSVTAGLAYKRGNAIKVTTDQKYQTRRAINEERVGMLSAPLVASNSTASARVASGFTELIDIFYDGEPSDFYFQNPPSEASTQSNLAASIIQDNRTAIQDAVLTYLNNANLNGYDQIKCERDVGLILDAVRRDLITESDYWTITAGNSYLRANSAYVLSEQNDATVAAVKFARDQVKALAGVTSDATIDVLFERVIDVLDGTITEIQPVTTYPLTGTYASTRGLQRDDILAARATLITDTTAFITANYPALVYDSVKCERDTGFLIDALVADLTYDGNTASREAALAYFVGTTSQLGAGEGTATVAAFLDLATRIKALTNVTEDSRVDTLIGITTDAITAGNTAGIPAVSVIRTFANGMVDTEHDAIFDATATIQSDTIDYVDDNFAIKDTNIKSYDAGKCSRDVGLILDAVRRDFVLETDYWTITAGNSYLRANSSYLIENQNFATIEAVKFARDTVKKLKNLDEYNPQDIFSDAQKTTLDTLFQRVIDVIDGTVSNPIVAITYPTNGTYASTRGLQATAITSARSTLIADTISFITTNYPALTYDQTKCERDTGFLIDALTADLTYDGNTASRQAALSYFVGTTSQLGDGESAATVAAFNNLASRIKALPDVNDDTDVDTLIALTTGVIEAGNIDSLPDETEISVAGLTTTEYDILLADTDEVQDATVEYVNLTFKPEYPDYDQVKCYRDIGLILDAIKRDQITGTDYNTITAGFAYLRANAGYVKSDQLDKTLKGIRYAGSEIKKVVATADSNIDTKIARITDVLEGYVTTYTTPTYPNPGGTFQSSANGDRPQAVANLQAGRAAAIDSLITYIDTIDPNLEYNTNKCKRDAGYVIDALCHDILYGGNTASRQNAASYYVGSISQLGATESSTTALAYVRLNSILSTYTVGLDTTITNEIQSLLDIIVDVINAGNLDNLVAEIEIDRSGLSTGDFNAITTATLQIQDDTISFINDLFFNPAYDQAKCARDVGLIVDAIALEYIAQSTAPSRLVALSYRRPQAQEVYLKQRAATLAAVNYLEDLLSGLVDTAGGNELGLVAPFQRIRDGINAGPYTSGVDRSWVSPNTSLYNGTAGGVDNTGSTANTRAAQNALNSFGSGYVSAVLNYVNNTLGVTSFDNQICGEDLLFILNALSYDVDTGTNWCIRQVAESYFSGVVNQLGNDSLEIQTTIAAYEYLKTYLTTTLPLDANLAQGTDQTASILAYITNEIDIVINVIKDQTTANMPALVYPSTVGENATDIIGFNTCLANRTVLQNQIVDFVNDSNPVDAFDDEKCARDTRLIIDAICLDIQNNTNYNSITAGLAYLRGNASKVKSDQLKYTVQSINYIRDLINGTAGISSDNKKYVTARILEITDIITASTDYGKNDGDPINYSTTSSTRGQINASNALRANRRTIQKQITTWIQVNFDTFEYDPDACERDVGYIIDGLVHDILYGGQYAAETIARSYWVGTDLNIEGNANQAENLDGVADNYSNQLGQGEVAVTKAAYDQLKVIINNYITTATEETRVNDLVTIINNSIEANDPTGIPNTPLILLGDAALINAQKTLYTDSTILYANQIFPAFTYDQVKCRRDVGFILDSLTYDIKYGGNSATSIAMRSYFSIFNNGYGDLLGQNEFTMTVKAFKHLKKVILESYLDSLDANINTIKNNLLDIIINALVQTNAGTFQLGNFFGAERSLDLYQYNYPTGLAAGYNTLVFPDLIALGYKVVFNALYLAHQAFNVGESERLTIIRSSNAVADNQGTDSTIFLKSGDYVVNNPIKLPPKTSIIGDALRSVTIRPKNVDSDIFWADNGVYIKEITFRDHQDGAAVLAFDPRVDSPGAGPFITQSPYVQNCTSLTSSGIGLRIDGSKVSGLRSMVLDAFTQFNAGGTGVYLLNRGYAQLVSLFTVSTTTSVLAETGGQCSLTNSNSSFGERGLVATGGSKSLYNGTMFANYIQNDNVIRISSITTQDSADYTLNLGDYKKPNYNDAIRFDSDNYYYTVLNVSPEILQDWGTTGNTTENEQGVFNTTSGFPQQTKTLSGKFGYATHMSNNDTYLAVSEINDGPGNVETYKKDIVGGVPQWNYEAQVVPTPPLGGASVDTDTNFGKTVALTGDGQYMVVGAPGQKQVDATPSTTANGAVYCYRRNVTVALGVETITWTQENVLNLPGVTDRDLNFGATLDLSENGLALFVSVDNATGPNTKGVVYYYIRTAPASTIWTLQQTITSADIIGGSVDVGQPRITCNQDGTDLLIYWQGVSNKIYYYQRNIDNKYLLAQQIIPRSNYLSANGRVANLRMNPIASHFALGDTQAPRGYFTNTYTDSDNSISLDIAKKQKLNNLEFSNIGGVGRITTTDDDRWINFENDFTVGTNATILGSASNDGNYVFTQVNQDSARFNALFIEENDVDVQLYVPQVGVSEFFTFFEGQWITEDIIEAPYTANQNYGYGASVDINEQGTLALVANNANSTQKNGVSIIERARSDWRRINTIEPVTPTNIVTQGDNDKFGSNDQSTSIAVGKTGDVIVIGASERREVVSDPATEYGSVFTYYSILEETGSYELTVAPALNKNLKSGQNASFHQRSLITASGHTFEYVGSGTNMFTAIPQNGGVPKKENEVQFDSAGAEFPNFGLVYFTATDELGDFRIGEDLTINREEGTITGVTFDRSLFAVLTPFILALEG